MKQHLFISKNVTDLSEDLKQFLEFHSVSFTAQSLISFEEVPFTCQVNCEALFFGSKRAVDFYLKSCTIEKDALISCIGKTTALHLESLGFTVHFQGENAGNPDEVAIQLKTFLNGKKLRVVRSTISNRSIPAHFSNEELEEIIVYNTMLNPTKISPKPSLLIFTSPSNAEAFLMQNTIEEDATIIAWGKTTESYLISRQFSVQKTLQQSSEEELISILEGIL
jgi:uroporphyrinogen-III synthase